MEEFFLLARGNIALTIIVREYVFTFWKIIAVAGIVQQCFRFYRDIVCVLHLLHLITL